MRLPPNLLQPNPSPRQIRLKKLQIRANDLDGTLQSKLLPVYFVTGDETLLVEEACDKIVAAARAQGYSEREVLHAESGFKWHDVLQSTSSMSLFAERRIVDVRVPNAKFDKEASEVLRLYVDNPPEDVLLLIRTIRLQARQKSSAWYKALDTVAGIVTVWPIGAAELPRWLKRRLDAAGLTLQADALAAFAERVEGNLLAAVQEIEKLKLQELPNPISQEDLLGILQDVSHHDAFELIDAAFGGQAQRVSRIVANLNEQGVSVFAILGALTAQLRRLSGGSRSRGPRARLEETFVARVGAAAIPHMIAECALIDRQVKGGLRGDAWLSLEAMLLRLAGARGVPLLRQHLAYRTLS